jgi:hypothetical protein
MGGDGNMLERLKDLKRRADGERVTLRARVLRFWEIGGMRMALLGDDSALIRVEIGDAALEESRSYEFREALVKSYPGGWHSLSVSEGAAILPLDEDVPISQSEEYIERTYKILAGIQRKKGRAAARIPPWRHPAAEQGDG